MEEKTILNDELINTDQQEFEKLKQQYVYLQADFENYRKRMDAQRGLWSQSAQTEVILPLLEIVDDFDRAQGDIDNPAFELIFKSFKKILQQFNVAEITENTIFDPNIHEALVQVPLIDNATSGEIAQVLQKGYRFGTTVLRPAKVAVYE